MSDVAALIADMVRSGVDPDIIGRTAEVIANSARSAPPPLTARQERNRRYYEKKKASEKRLNKTDLDGSDGLDDPSPKVPPHTPLPNPNLIPPSPPKGGSSPKFKAEFEEFWDLYPNKVGKRKADEAFRKARKRAEFDEIMAGLRLYVGKTDDRPWCNPATWLNQDRWMDAPATSPQIQQPAVEDVERWQKRLLWARGKRQWATAEWGPMPGMQGCRAPPQLLEEGDGDGWTEREAAA